MAEHKRVDPEAAVVPGMEDVGDARALMLSTSDKAVSTNTLALTYEAVFSSLIEHKVLAMKRDCEERKRLKRMKRKSIGRILFSKKLFGSGSRKSSADGGEEQEEEGEGVGHSETQQSAHSKSCPTGAEAIETASPSTSSAKSAIARAQMLKSAPTTEGAVVPPGTPLAVDDSLTSTFSNDNPSYSSADKNSSGAIVVKRSLLVRAQTHGPSTEVESSSGSGESLNIATRLSASGLAAPLTASYNDATSFASCYDHERGAGAHPHTSTMAEGSLTSIRDDSIDSLSFASSRCTVSFGGTEVIPEDTASLLYERSRVAKRLRILEAKSISAQCSPILPRHVFKASPVPLPTSALAITAPALLSLPPPPSAPTTATTTSCRSQVQTQQRLLQNQASFTDSMCGDRFRADSDAAVCFFSRQNTSEDSANLTVSTLLNEGDSLSLHALTVHSTTTSSASKKPFNAAERYKSKSTSLLVGRRPPPAVLVEQLEQSEQLPISSNTRNNGRLVVSLSNNNHNVHNITIDANNGGIASTPPPPPQQQQQQQQHYIPVITPTVAAITASTKYAVGTLVNGVVNGAANRVAVVSRGTLSGDTAKLHRMTSTSTGSSVAPTGCCATTKSSSRDREKQRFNPSRPSGQSGSDDEYRRRKRKYKRYHRCSDPVLVNPSPGALQHCILSMPPNDPTQFHYNEDFVYDMQLQVESDKNDDLQEIVPSNNRHRKHRHHKHKKRHRHKKPKILVHDLDTQVVKVIDPDDLPQRARWTIIATACLLLLMCLMLVGITLRMAPIIDDMGASLSFYRAEQQHKYNNNNNGSNNKGKNNHNFKNNDNNNK